MADFFAKSSTIETVSTKDTLPEKTDMSSLVTDSANDAPASSRMKDRIKNTAAGRCYFPPGGRAAGVAVFEEANERGSLVLKDEYNGELDGGNANRKKTGADTMGLQDDYDPNWRDNVADTVKTKALPVNKNAGFQRQQNHRTQLPGQMHRPHPVAARHPSSGHFPPLSPYVLQNNQASLHQMHLRDKRFATSPNDDRYAIMEQQEVDRRDDMTLVGSGPPHSSVGMAGYVMGGYGRASMNHNGMMGHQVYHGIAGNGERDGNVGEITWNNNTGHQMTMAQRPSLPAPNALMGFAYNNVYQMEHQGQQLWQRQHQVDYNPRVIIDDVMIGNRNTNTWNNGAGLQQLLPPTAPYRVFAA